MRDDLSDLAQPPIDPIAMARRDLAKALPRRFWTEVSIAARDGSFGIELDGKPVRTPAKAEFLVPTRVLAEVVAAEWRAQEEVVDPTTMPTTKLVNSAIDGVATTMAATAAEVAKFAETDLVCYRAGTPAPLVAAESAAWDPVLAFARDELAARFVLAEGVMYVEQPAPARAAVRSAVDAIASGPAGALRLAALSVMTSLTGSVLIALAVAGGRMSWEAGWAAACVDEDFQMDHWGSDAEALARRDLRTRDMRIAAETCALSL